jgi:hypothetical protein
MFIQLTDMHGRELFLRAEDFSASYLEDLSDGAVRTVVVVRGYISGDDYNDGNPRVIERPDQVIRIVSRAMEDVGAHTWTWGADGVREWEPIDIPGPDPKGFPVAPSWLLPDRDPIDWRDLPPMESAHV